MNISESLGWQKTLKARHAELQTLRNSNAARTSTTYGNNNPVTTIPVYDAIKLDKRITLIARELRLLDESIKRTNAATEVTGFLRDDAVLGELEA